MADGHLAINNALVIQLVKQDESFLQKLADKLKTKIHYISSINSYTNQPTNYVRISIQDKERLQKYRQTLKMKETAKTYFPPDLSIFAKEEYFLSFFIGFTDGDGCI